MKLPAAPVDTAGEWVTRENFKGRKSFGWFVCKCKNRWISAHAFSRFKQGCTKCDKYCFPKMMWENDADASVNSDDSDASDDSGGNMNDKPHLRHLCEACKRGVCTAGR